MDKYWDFVKRENEKYTRLGKEFAKECIENFDPVIVESWDMENQYLAEFVGTVFQVMPSGKYYTPWANSNVTWVEAGRDYCFMEGFKSELNDNGFWYESGEGDPCDMFICKSL